MPAYIVMKAWKYSSKENRCYIVVFDWLEDCLQGHKRKRTERGYTLDRTLTRIKKGKTDHDKFRTKFEEGVRASKELCDNRESNPVIFVELFSWTNEDIAPYSPDLSFLLLLQY